MKILLITNYFYPETGACASRTQECAKNWTKTGNDVTILTGFPNYPHYKIFKGYENTFIKKEIWNDITIMRTYTYVQKDATIFKRAIGQVIFMVCSVIGGCMAPRSDVIVATSPPFTVGLTAIMVGIIRRTPYVFDVRDPYPQSPIELGVIQSPVLIYLLKAIEKNYYKYAKIVVTVTNGFKELLIKNGCSANKCKVITNGVNVEYFEKDKTKSRNAIAKEFGVDDKLNIVYTGTLGRVHNLKIMVDAAQRVNDYDDIQFIVVGDGIKYKEVEKLIKKYNLKNFILKHSMPQERVKNLLSIADIGFQALEDIDYIAAAHAIKIFEYMAMGVPVLFSGRGESKKLVEEADSGICCGLNDVDCIVDAILFLRNNPDKSLQYGRNGRIHVEKLYNREKLSAEYMDLLKKL